MVLLSIELKMVSCGNVLSLDRKHVSSEFHRFFLQTLQFSRDAVKNWIEIFSSAESCTFVDWICMSASIARAIWVSNLSTRFNRLFIFRCTWYSLWKCDDEFSNWLLTCRNWISIFIYNLFVEKVPMKENEKEKKLQSSWFENIEWCHRLMSFSLNRTRFRCSIKRPLIELKAVNCATVLTASFEPLFLEML